MKLYRYENRRGCRSSRITQWLTQEDQQCTSVKIENTHERCRQPQYQENSGENPNLTFQTQIEDASLEMQKRQDYFR